LHLNRELISHGKTFSFWNYSNRWKFYWQGCRNNTFKGNFQHGINTIIISPRRYGKTSLVHKVGSVLNDDAIKVIYLDVFSCRTEQEFYKEFASSVIKQTSTRWEDWVNNAKQFLSSVPQKFLWESILLMIFQCRLILMKKRGWNRSTEPSGADSQWKKYKNSDGYWWVSADS